jgi:hypothetical protein
MILIRHVTQLFCRVAVRLPELLSSAGADAWHGVHYGCEFSPNAVTQPTAIKNLPKSEPHFRYAGHARIDLQKSGLSACGIG